MTTNLINGKKYIGADSNNNPKYLGSGQLIKLALNKYGINSFKKEILEECVSIDNMFEREIYWINKYDAVNSSDFYNLAEGGKGGNKLLNELSYNKWLKNRPNIIELNKNRKGKTYEELYGEKSKEEKEKRKIASTNIEFSEERKNNISKGLKGNIPWNKGLTKETSDKVKKYSKTNSENRLNRPLKTYELYIDNIFYKKFNGKKELECFIKTYNIDRKKGTKINVDTLIQKTEHRNLKVKLCSIKNPDK